MAGQVREGHAGPGAPHAADVRRGHPGHPEPEPHVGRRGRARWRGARDAAAVPRAGAGRLGAVGADAGVDVRRPPRDAAADVERAGGGGAGHRRNGGQLSRHLRDGDLPAAARDPPVGGAGRLRRRGAAPGAGHGRGLRRRSRCCHQRSVRRGRFVRALMDGVRAPHWVACACGRARACTAPHKSHRSAARRGNELGRRQRPRWQGRQ